MVMSDEAERQVARKRGMNQLRNQIWPSGIRCQVLSRLADGVRWD
jgi:hypothetical protein